MPVYPLMINNHGFNPFCGFFVLIQIDFNEFFLELIMLSI